MGLTIQADTILASGHPAPDNQDDTFTAPNIGLVRHTQTGWEQVALAGSPTSTCSPPAPPTPTSFSGCPRTGRSWLPVVTRADLTDLGPLTARDISIDTMKADVVTATTPEGLMVSRDGGITFTTVANAPALLVITADPTVEEGIIGVDSDGTIWTGGTTEGAVWKLPGALPESPRRSPPAPTALSRSLTKAGSASPLTPETPGGFSSGRTLQNEPLPH